MMDIERFYSEFSKDELDLLKRYLRNNGSNRKKQNFFNIVIDLLNGCNLACVGCGIDAINVQNGNGFKYATIDELEIACRKIKEFAEKKGKKVFVNLGGGEPLLRGDLEDVVLLFNSYFGNEGIGIDTNATVPNAKERIERILPYVTYVGISVNGLENTHNYWSGSGDYSAFCKTTKVIRELVKDEQNASKLEVTSVATTENIEQLPQLMEMLSEKGVKNYSVHRSVPVGRMRRHLDMIPNASQYTRLLIDLIKTQDKTGLVFHLHHSIENIHKSLLLGRSTYHYNKIGDKNTDSSIGVDPWGNVVFNAWCMSGNWLKLSCGNMFNTDLGLEKMLEDENTAFSKANIASSMNNRCKGCKAACSGGSRVVAAATALAENNEEDYIRATWKQLISSFSSIDPACPLYGKDVVR